VKKKYSFAKTERERRYPILTALDQALHHLLAVGLVIVAAGMVVTVFFHQSPTTTIALDFATRFLGLGID